MSPPPTTKDLHGQLILRLEEKDFGKKMVVQVRRATNLDSKDTNGYSDPYCVLHYRGKKYKTKTIKKNLNPIWEQDFELNDIDDSSLHVEVYDWDRLAKDDFIGEAYIDFRPQKKNIELTIPLRSKNYYKTNPHTTYFDPAPIPTSSLSPCNPLHAPSTPRGGGGGGGEGGEDGDVCDFRRLGRVQTGVVGMEILRRVGSVVDNELKKTTSNQVRSVGVWGAMNPAYPFQHAGSLEIKLRYDPETSSLWVLISRAADLDAKDEKGSSDPYVFLQCGKCKKKTAVVRKNLNPTFSEEFEFDIFHPNVDLKIQVWDWDKYSQDDFIGGCLVPINVLPEGKLVNTWLFLNGKFSTSWSSRDQGMIGQLNDEQSRIDQNNNIKRNELLSLIFLMGERTDLQKKCDDIAQEEYFRRKRRKVVSSQFPRKAFFFFLFQFLLFIVLNVIWISGEEWS